MTLSQVIINNHKRINNYTLMRFTFLHFHFQYHLDPPGFLDSLLCFGLFLETLPTKCLSPKAYLPGKKHDMFVDQINTLWFSCRSRQQTSQMTGHPLGRHRKVSHLELGEKSPVTKKASAVRICEQRDVSHEVPLTGRTFLIGDIFLAKMPA